MLKNSDDNHTNMIKPSEFQRTIDNAHVIHHLIDKDVIRRLFLEYGQYAEFILNIGKKINKNKLIGKKKKILQSQILFEINFLHLNSPIDFLIKRNNYYQFLKENDFIEISKILTVFANEQKYNLEKYQLEHIKLLAYKYLLTKYTLD